MHIYKLVSSKAYTSSYFVSKRGHYFRFAFTFSKSKIGKLFGSLKGTILLKPETTVSL